MKHFLLASFAAAALSSLVACDKPTADECRDAINNMEKLLGTEAAARNTDNNDGDVRRCRGGSRKEAVACAIKATTLDELKACAFMTPKASANK